MVRPSYLLYTSNYNMIQSQQSVLRVCFSHLTAIRSQTQRSVLRVCYTHLTTIRSQSQPTDLHVCYIFNYHTITVTTGRPFVFVIYLTTIRSQSKRGLPSCLLDTYNYHIITAITLRPSCLLYM